MSVRGRPAASGEAAGTARAGGESMTISVRLFAVLRERAGRDAVELELAPTATVADALRALAEIDELREVLPRLPVRMAVNREYADEATPLRRGDELALIPPLSGGGAPAQKPAAPVSVRLSRSPLARERVREAVSDPAAGAIVVFEGVTRTVAELDYEAYSEMASERIEAIMRDCVRAHELCSAAAEHRVGRVPLGQPSVIVAVSAPHRAAAFAAAREAIDRIKAEAPIWKRELPREGESRWVPGTPAPSPHAHVATQRPPAPLTHIAGDGSARMVDVGAKQPSERVARARARVRMSPATAAAVQAGNGPKGEVLGVARIAGIQAAKQTAQLIPLAHPLPLSFVDVVAGVDVAGGIVELLGEARTVARTGVEMEAMTACTVAALTVYDMVKGVERGVELEQVVLLEKRGGKSDYVRED